MPVQCLLSPDVAKETFKVSCVLFGASQCLCYLILNPVFYFNFIVLVPFACFLVAISSLSGDYLADRIQLSRLSSYPLPVLARRILLAVSCVFLYIIALPALIG